MDLVRLAVPRPHLRQSHLDYVIEAVPSPLHMVITVYRACERLAPGVQFGPLVPVFMSRVGLL